MKKNCCGVYYPERDSHIRDKVKVVLDLSSYATRKELEHATGVETSEDFITIIPLKSNRSSKKCCTISEKGYDILLGRMYFTGADGYQNFLIFTSILSSLILDSNRKVTDWISTRILSEKIKPFDTGLERTMSELANCRINLKCNNSVLVHKSVSSLYSNLFKFINSL